MTTMKELSELNLLDRFLFDEAAEDPVFMKTVLEIILKRDIILEELPQSEKEERLYLLAKQIRLDVWAQDVEGTVYNTEVQKRNTHNLPKRSRYYHGIIGSKLLAAGELDYNKLSDVYVIIIAPFDLFGLGLHRYTFRMFGEEDKELELGDGMTTIFLNTRGTEDDIDEELKSMLAYFEDSSDDVAVSSGSERIRVLQSRVNDIRRNEEIGVKYMLAWEEKALDRQEARKEGHAEGREEKEREDILAAMQEGLSKDVILKVFKITPEKYNKYLSML